MVYSILKLKLLIYAIIRLKYSVMARFLFFTGFDGVSGTRFYTRTLKVAIFHDKAASMSEIMKVRLMGRD